MRNGLQFYLAPLASHQNRGIADMIRSDGAVLDFDKRQRGGRAGAELPDGLVRSFNAVKNCGTQFDGFAVFPRRSHDFLKRFLNRFDRYSASPFAAGMAA